MDAVVAVDPAYDGQHDEAAAKQVVGFQRSNSRREGAPVGDGRALVAGIVGHSFVDLVVVPLSLDVFIVRGWDCIAAESRILWSPSS
jgi:hypothetical protein